MKNVNKKLFMSLGLVASATTPVVAVVSCGSKTINSVQQKSEELKQFEHLKALNEKNIEGAYKVIEAIKAIAPQPTTAIKTDAKNLKASDLVFPELDKQYLQWGVYLEVSEDSIKVDATNETIANFIVYVKSTLSGTEIAQYNSKVTGLLTSKQYDANAATAAQSARDAAKNAAQNAINSAVTAAKEPILFNADNKKLTAFLISPEMFSTMLVDATQAVTARVVAIDQSIAAEDGTEVIATVRVSSTVAGTTPKEYKVTIKGFVSNTTYELQNHIKLTKTYTQMTLADLPKDGIVWERGIPYYAYAQSISYLRNFVEKLGWSSPDRDIVIPTVSNSTNVEGYTSKTAATPLEQSIQEDMKTYMTGLEGIGISFASGKDSLFSIIKAFISNDPTKDIDFDGVYDGEPIISNNIFDSKLFTDIKDPLVPATENNIAGASNHITVKLSSSLNVTSGKLKNDLSNLGDANILKIAYALQTIKNNENFANGAMFSSKILFSIDESTNTLHLWTKVEQANIDKFNSTYKTSIDAFHAPHIKAGVDTTTVKPLSATNGLLVDPGGIDHTPNQNAVGILKDFNWDEAFGAYESDGDFEKIQFEKFGSWIDGDHPGQLKLKLWTANDEADHGSQLIDNPTLKPGITRVPNFGTYSHTYESQPNAYPIFKQLENNEKDKYMLMVWNMIQNMKHHFDLGTIEMATGFINPDFLQILKFLVNTPITESKFREVFDKLNNGSHYFPAIEVFARGIKGLDGDLRPRGGSSMVMSMIPTTARRVDLSGSTIGAATSLDGKDIINYIYKDDDHHYDSLTQKNI